MLYCIHHTKICDIDIVSYARRLQVMAISDIIDCDNTDVNAVWMSCESIVIRIIFEDIESHDIKMSLKYNTTAVRNVTMSRNENKKDNDECSKYDFVNWVALTFQTTCICIDTDIFWGIVNHLVIIRVIMVRWMMKYKL